MTVFQRRPRLTAQLPPAVVTPDLHDRLTQFARENNASVSEIIRCAVEFFLSANSSKSTDDSRNTIEEVTS